MSALVVRRETARDAELIRAVHRAAFARDIRGARDARAVHDGGEPVEVGLVDALRADPAWLPHLSLVAVVDGSWLDGSGVEGGVVGHVVATRATAGGATALGLGPIGVLPAFQGRGVGRALMYALLGAAQAGDETLVALLGDPQYYGRFGFVAAENIGVRSPDPAWGRHFQALALTDTAPSGGFRYAAPFDGLG